jgi:glutamate synthase (NADPH/NADH) large chain
MSGGIAYVWDKFNELPEKCNLSMVTLEGLNAADKKTIKDLLQDHFKYTRSILAKDILDNFVSEIRRFVKNMPIEYKRVIEERTVEETELELLEVSDG